MGKVTGIVEVFLTADGTKLGSTEISLVTDVSARRMLNMGIPVRNMRAGRVLERAFTDVLGWDGRRRNTHVTLKPILLALAFMLGACSFDSGGFVWPGEPDAAALTARDTSEAVDVERDAAPDAEPDAEPEPDASPDADCGPWICDD